MADNTVIARVSAIQGQAFAKDKSGALRTLRVGDAILEGEVIVTAENSRVDLATPDGRSLVMRGNETLTVDAEVAGAVKPDATDAALLAGGTDVDKVIKAINDGGSLDALLEETAAGAGAGGADGGSSFVRLLRVVEGVDPLSFEFDTARRGAVNEIGREADGVVGGAAINGVAAGVPTIASVTADTRLEGTSLVHTVTLSNASSSATTFAYSLGGGTATGGGTDYTTPPTFSNGVTLAGGILTVPAGVTSFTVTVPTTLDTIDEGAVLNRCERVQIHQQFQPRHLSVRVREFRQSHLLLASRAQVKFRVPHDRATGEVVKHQTDQHP